MIALSILSGLVSLAVPVVIVVLVVRALTGRNRTDEASPPGQVIRRFFQYLLLYGVLVVVASGLATLLGLVGGRDPLVDTSGSLARALTFLLIGVPLLWVLWRWTRGIQASVAGETRSLGWLVYVGLATLTGAGVMLASVQPFLAAATRARFDGPALAQAVVWAAVWLVHLRLEARTTEPEHRRLHHLLGSFLGWAVCLVGLVAVLSASLDALLVPQRDVLVGSWSTLGPAAALVVAGIPVWLVYWWRRERSAPVSPLWFGYVLLVGVGVSLVTTVAGASVALYRGLVWLVGDLGGESTASWTSGTLTAVSVAAVGGLSWWYHREVVVARAPAGRSEVVRVHEYLLAGVALLAAAVGVVLVVVAFLEAVTPTTGVLVDSSLVNSVLAALTLLVVGGPLWWTFWRRIRRAVAADRPAESASPSRRIYLYALFGVTGVVAVVVVLVAVYGLLDAALGGTFGADTVRAQRVPLGILVAAGALAAYHWSVHREDRRLAPPRPEPVATAPGVAETPAADAGTPGTLDQVLLVGPRDDALVAAVVQATGARVDLWVQPAGRWDGPAVLDALSRATHRQVLLHAQGEQMLEAGPPR